MLMLHYDANDRLIGVSDIEAGKPEGTVRSEGRHEWKTLAAAERAAAAASRFLNAGRPMRFPESPEPVVVLPIDAGANTWPRYDIIVGFAVGQDVSMAINGDYYPIGKVTAISASHRIVTTQEPDGKVRRFYRRKNTASWKHDRSFTLVPGIHDERNPHI
jgi:hypothetical protein